MSDTRARLTDPRLLLEAARVFNAAGTDYKTIAEVVAESALQARDKADPTVRDAIIGDAVALRLSGRMPGGYRAALELLKEMGPDADGRLHLLRALAEGQKYKEAQLGGKPKDDPELVALRRQIQEDLAFAFGRNERLKVANQHFWRPTAALAEVGDREDDLWAVYKDDPEFRKLVDLPTNGAVDAGSLPARNQPSDTSSSPQADPGSATAEHENRNAVNRDSSRNLPDEDLTQASVAIRSLIEKLASQVSGRWSPTSSLIGTDTHTGIPVMRPDGAKIGTITHLFINKSSNEVAYAGISLDGFLGIGEEYRAVPWSVLRLNQSLGGYELNVPLDHVRNAPKPPTGWDAGEVDRAWEEQLHSHFRVEPYWITRQSKESSD